VDPVTGFSRRGVIALGATVAFGIVAATVASFIEERTEAPCPDRRYGCATFHAGEPILIGALFPSTAASGGVEEAVELRGGTLLGRPVEVLAWAAPCTAEGGAEAARELATDPPDGPPVIAVVGATCRAATTPAAQILSDSGITLISTNGTELPSTVGRPRYYLRYSVRGMDSSLLAAELVFQAAERLAVPGPDGDLLVPRTPLHDALLSAGVAPGR
jgi:hypothetical protein